VDARDNGTSKTTGRWGAGLPVGGDGSAGQGLRVDTTATAGGGWRQRGKAVKVATAGGVLSRWL
jgi:hypothetical protein